MGAFRIARTAVAAGLLSISGAALAAATAYVVPSTDKPSEGDTFTVLVSGTGFPETSSATLGLTWNAKVVSVTSIELVSVSPFTDLVAEAPWDMVTILGPITGTMPSGSFDAFQVTFKALAKGRAEIQVVDDGADLSWTAADASPIAVTYQQADVEIVTPLPAAAWLFASALGVLGWQRKRQAVA
jgi:hypothetical protein